MCRSYFVILLLFLTFLEAMTVGVDVALKTNGIVPDIIDKAPSKLIEVTYPSGAKVNLGNELTPYSVKDIPRVMWDADPKGFYTLLMTDPDAPSRTTPTSGEVRHWLIVNVPGNKITEGKTIIEYRGSGPSKGSGLHRYVFLVWKQNEPLSLNIITNIPKAISKTKTRDLIKNLNFDGVVAANFYQAQYDDYVGSRAQTKGNR